MTKSPHLKIVETGTDTSAEAPELPYRIELADGDEPQVLALCGTPNVAYAAYYAGLREYFGRSVALFRDGRLLASSHLR